MIMPVIEMPVFDSVSSEKLKPVEQIDLDTKLDISFAIRVLDNGLQYINVHEGDLLLFKKTTWATDYEQIVFGCYENEEFYLRVLEQFDLNGQVRLRAGKEVSPIKTFKDNIAVRGISSHVYKHESNKIYFIDTFDGRIKEVSNGKIYAYTE
jgi:hypothetical protein